MEAPIRAAIDLQGAHLRYAEVEHVGGRRRLIRLGSCDFDFDVAHEVLRAEEPLHLGLIAEAITDIFKGITASLLSVVVPAPDAIAFATPLPASFDEADARSRLEAEITLLAGSADPHHVDTAPLYRDDQGDEWHHVLAVSSSVHDRLGVILEGLPPLTRRSVLPAQAAGAVALELSESYGTSGECALLVGDFADHLELAVIEGERLRRLQPVASSAPTDAAYFAAGLLQDLGLSVGDVGAIILFGPDPEPDRFAPLQRVFRKEPTVLNPLAVVDLAPGSLSSGFDQAAYAGCIGATL